MAHIEMPGADVNVTSSGRGARLRATEGDTEVAIEMTQDQARTVGRSLIATANRPPAAAVDGARRALLSAGVPGRFDALLRHMGTADRAALEDFTRMVRELASQRDSERRKRREGRFFR